jgi:redox-sensitive bicupin YhaK (pirin superfamily)
LAAALISLKECATVCVIVAGLSNSLFDAWQLSTDWLLMRDFLRFFDRLSRLTIWLINQLHVEMTMIEVRPFAQLGGANHGWLNAKHHFSFASYYDSKRMNWGQMRVWNDDTIQPHTGFATHPHQDMEIITYVRQGAISHQDSLGNKGRTIAGDVQVMSAGTGIRHSEYNHEDEVTKIFQIWIHPEQTGLPPSWGTRPFPRGENAGEFVTLASGLKGDDEALPIRAKARLVAATLDEGHEAKYEIAPGRKAYLVVAKGAIEVNGVAVKTGDGAAIQSEKLLNVKGIEQAEVVLVDVA